MRIHYLSFIAAVIFLFAAQTTTAQFGKNKVQYDDFKWKYIQSKHFDVYFSDGSEYLARFTAVEAERALISIQNTLNFKITRRIPYVVYNSHNEFQQTNVVYSFMPEGVGGVTELMKNRIVIPYQGDYNQFRHVIHHELTHAVLNDLFYGGTFQTALSTGNLTEIPIWMNEGLCEYESNRGYDTQTDMFMRDVSLSEYLTDLQDMDGYFAYRGGQAFYWYVAEKYGRQRVGDLMNRLRVLGNVDAAFKSAFHLSIEDFSEQWKKDMKKYYWPDIEKFKDPTDYAIRLTNHDKDRNYYNSSPAISPKGDKMAFISAPGGLFGVYIMDIEKKDEPREVVSSFRQQDFEDLNMLTPGISWSPDGTSLAISAKAGGEDALFIVKSENGDYSKFKFGIKSISSVNWSPDGKSIAFIGSVIEKSDIFVYDLENRKLINLTNDIFSDFNPVWSKDSKTIYFISDRGDNDNLDNTSSNFKMWNYEYAKSDIYSIHVESKEINRITNTPEFGKTSIAISPDEKKLLYVSDDNGIGNIYELDIATGKSKPKTNSLTGITQISLAPDASKLLFCTQIHGGYDIFMLRFPFEKNFELDTLPLTKFRENSLEKSEDFDNLTESASISVSDSSEQDSINYGNFEIEFDRQQIVKPNTDAQEQRVSISSENSDALNDSNFIVNDYKITFSPDVILGNPGYSTFWGFQGVSQMLFSDVLGDHQIYLQLNLLYDLKNSNFYAQYLYLPEIIDYSISGFHAAGFAYGTDDTLYRYRSYGGAFGAYYPFDLFNRIQWGLSVMNVSKENLDNLNSPSISRLLLVPEFKYVHDDVLWGAFGPVRGSRYNVGIIGTPKMSNDGIGFLTISGDFRHYIRLNEYMSIALRGSAGKSVGPNPQTFFLGGTENWFTSYRILPFNNPEDFAFRDQAFIWPLRGYDLAAVTGSQYFVTNVEYRFPLFRALLPGPVPILFQSIMGCLFFDMGGAWNGNFTDFKATIKNENGKDYANDLLMSSGVGIRSYVLGLPLKLDIAWANEFHVWSKPFYMVSLGYDF